MIPVAKLKAALKPHRSIVGACEHIKRIGQGENNEVFLVESDNGKHVMRVGLKSDLDKNMRRAFLFLKKIDCPSAPKALVFDSSKNVLPYAFEVLSYTEGEQKRRWTKRHLSSFAQAVAELHLSEKRGGWGPYGRRKEFSLVDQMRLWMREYDEELEVEPLRHLYAHLERHLQDNDNMFTSLRSFTAVHGDACADNILFHEGKASLIDWEWSEYGDPAQDLARLFFTGGTIPIPPWHLHLSKENVAYLIQEYQKHRKDKNLPERVQLWNEATTFGNMVFLKWNIAHYDRKTSPLPKMHYQSVYKKMLEYYEKKYG